MFDFLLKVFSENAPWNSYHRYPNLTMSLKSLLKKDHTLSKDEEYSSVFHCMMTTYPSQRRVNKFHNECIEITLGIPLLSTCSFLKEGTRIRTCFYIQD